MQLSKSKRTPARTNWSMPALLACLCVALSACAATRQPIVTPAAIVLTPSLRESPCLRGRLPDPATLTVGELGAEWVRAEARAECERERGDALAGVIDGFNAAQATARQD